MMDEQETDFFGGSKGARYVPPELERDAVHLSDQAGFTLRQPPREPLKRQRGTRLQLHNYTMRLHVDDMDAFVRFCDGNRLTYREAFAKAVALLTHGEGDSR